MPYKDLSENKNHIDQRSAVYRGAAAAYPFFFEYPRMIFHYSIIPIFQYSCGLSRGHAQGGCLKPGSLATDFFICHGG